MPFHAPLPFRKVRELVSEAGFDDCGFARAEPIPPGFLAQWVDAGMAADMDWYTKRIAERLDVRKLLPTAKTVLALAANYYVKDPATESSPIARYARGRDYHATLQDRMRTLRRLLRETFPGVEMYQSVDHGPCLEKVWAARAGLGFVGKNGCLITPRFGSYVVLCVLILDTDAEVLAEGPTADVCGKCRLCIEACPTDAITSERQVDARKCISYLTIENEGAVPDPLAGQLSGWVFGCDTCQTVCPLNDAPLAAKGERFAPRAVAALSVEQIAAMTPEEYAALVPGTALGRAQYGGLRRNAVYALGAAGAVEARPLLERLRTDADERVRVAAEWALGRLAPAP